MAYATIDDVTKRYRPIETVVGSGEFDVASVDVSSIYITDAEAFVNARLRDRYVVPFSSPVDQIITKITADLAICEIVRDKLTENPEFIQGRCDRAEKMLEDLRKGEMDLGSADLVTTNEGDIEVWSSTQDWHAVVSPVLDPLDQSEDRDRVESDQDDRRGDRGSGYRRQF